MPNYIKLGNLRIEIPEPANNGGGGGGGGGSSSLLTGLLAFYNLNDLSDASGNNRTLTNNGNVTFSPGKIGNAAVFNGSNRLTRLIPQTINQLTISAWVKASSTQLNWGNIIGIGRSSEFNIFAQTNGNGLLAVYAGSVHSSSTNILDNTWHNIVATLNDSGNAKVYDNGSLILDVDIAPINLNNFEVQLGTDYVPSSDTFFNGQIDAVGIWNRVLTDAEVTELYNAGAGKEHPFA